MMIEQKTNTGENGDDLLKLICDTIQILPENKSEVDEEDKMPKKQLKAVSLEDIEEQLGFHDCTRTEELGNGLLSPTENDFLKSTCRDFAEHEVIENICGFCGVQIMEQFLLKVQGYAYHEVCLHCSVCKISLGESQKCFFHGGRIYCREDFMNSFGTKCAKCELRLSPVDWVREVDGLYFHLDCFSCSNCNFQLATGDDFGVKDGKLLCKNHFLEVPSLFADSSPEPETKSQGQKRKRARTTFADDQLSVLHEYFKVDPNPQGFTLTEIAEKVKLSRRVTQIWFQNARQKRRQQKLQELS